MAAASPEAKRPATEPVSSPAGMVEFVRQLANLKSTIVVGFRRVSLEPDLDVRAARPRPQRRRTPQGSQRDPTPEGGRHEPQKQCRCLRRPAPRRPRRDAAVHTLLARQAHAPRAAGRCASVVLK